MENYKAKEGQTLYDVILACYGSLDHVVKFCYDNDLSAFSLIETGRDYVYDETVGDFTITKTFEKQQSSPNNAQTPPEPDFYFKMSGDVYFIIPEMQWSDTGVVEIDRSFETNQLFNPTGFNDFFAFIYQNSYYSAKILEESSSGTVNGVAYLELNSARQRWRNVLLTKNRQTVTYAAYKTHYEKPNITAGFDTNVYTNEYVTQFKIGRIKNNSSIDCVNAGIYGVKFYNKGVLLHNYRATKEGVLKDEITGVSLSPINKGGTLEIVQYSEYTQPAKTGDIIADFQGGVIVDTGIKPNTDTVVKTLIRNPYKGYNGNYMFGSGLYGAGFHVNDDSWEGSITSTTTEIEASTLDLDCNIGGSVQSDDSISGIDMHTQFVELEFGASVGLKINGVEKIPPFASTLTSVENLCIGGLIVAQWDYVNYGMCQIKSFDIYENGEAGGLTKSLIPSIEGCLIDQDNKKYFPAIGKDKINILYENE